MKRQRTIILGIECTAHTLGASVVDSNGTILSNINMAIKSDDSGLIPVEIMEHHAQNARRIIMEALETASMSISDVTHIAVSNAPGMGHALRVGNIISKAISRYYDIPVIMVNHSMAHLTTGIMDFGKESKITLLYAAGANTQLWNLNGDMLMLVGESLDMGIGHLLDLSSRAIGYGFPGGPIIEELAAKHIDSDIIELPYTIKGMDVSFSGIATAFKNKASKAIKDYDSGMVTKEEKESQINALSYSLQEHSFSALIEASERAIALQDSTGLSIIGGVALNKRFCGMAMIMCDDRGAIMRIPPRELLADNAGMIALEGLRMLQSGCNPIVFMKGETIRIDPYERLPRKMEYSRLHLPGV
jgi:glycoprotease/Kae1 family metallohydrolase